MSFEVNGKTYETDEEGYLADLSEWNAEIADYMAKGDEETEREIERTRGIQTKVNKIAAALLFALNREGKKWQFTEAEGEFGMHIKPIAKKFLESNPKNYAKNLQKLISSTGSTEDIIKKKV